MIPKVLVPLAPGVEEMEAVIIIDVLRRAGWEVVTAGLVEGSIQGSRDVELRADAPLSALDLNFFSMLVLPGGGGGVEGLSSCEGLFDMAARLLSEGQYVGAICAAPLILHQAGLLQGRRCTSHPTVQDQLVGAEYLEERVVVDGTLVTSRGPGTAFDFALKLVELVDGEKKAALLAKAMCL